MLWEITFAGAKIVTRLPGDDINDGGFDWSNYTFATFSVAPADADLESEIRSKAGVQ